VRPAAPFPARIAVVRAQASGYRSESARCFGTGLFCVVTTRDIEPEEALDRLSRLPQVTGVARVTRLLLPPTLESTRELRRVAATLHTDLLLVYSVDTGFTVEHTEIGPLAVISLGFLPNKTARVSSTASAALFDVRTGFLYGVAEATASEHQRTTAWSTVAAIDNARRKAEAEAFGKLIGEIEGLWSDVLRAHASPRPSAAGGHTR
jgi:hypothetical protein